MTQSTRDISDKLARRLGAMSDEERQHLNADQIQESEREHASFKEAFDRGNCYLCGRGLSVFVENDPCLHWFMRPAGVKKRHYPAVAEKFGMMQVQSWLRWVANEGGWAKNIADTADADHVVQMTARYGDFDWSISCGRTDFEGHPGRDSNYPHYHLQMSIKGRPFISYNDFHFRIHRDEWLALSALAKAGGKSKFIFGESFDELMATVDPETIINLPLGDSDPDSAPFNMQTIIVADEGANISGEAIYEMIRRAREDGVTIASRVHEIPNASAQTVITEGPGVVDPAPRQGGRRSASKGD